MPTQLKNNETILFIGDSITDCGRCGETHRPLGNGYVRMVADMLTIREPQKNSTVVNRGISGDKISDLRNRWHDDVFEIKPDWLSIKIGINDLCRTLEGNADLPSDKFEEIYDSLLAQTVKRLPDCKLLLIAPFYMSRDRMKDSYRAQILRTLPGYMDAVHRLSRKYKTRLVKTHDLFQKQLKHHKLAVFSTEPIHPNSAGHFLMAEAIYKTLLR